MPRYLGVGKESTYGVAAAATSWYDIIRENMAVRRTTMLNKDTVADRQITRAARGEEYVEGEIELYLNSQQIGHLLLSCLGSVVTSGTGPYMHVFSVAESLPSLTLRSGLDNVKEKVVVGAIVDSLEVVAEVGKARVRAGIIGRQLMLGDVSSPSFTEKEDFTHGDVWITIGGVTKRPRRITLKMNNNLERIHVLGDSYLQKLKPKKFEVTGSFDLDFESDAEYQDFLSLASRDLNIRFEKGDHRIEFDIKRFVYTDAKVEVRGREILVANFEFAALKSNVQDSVKIMLVNDDREY
ncbi:MAG: phage tail tube protein [Nitrososphaerota archaeon]|nr:phage tail tube protein [Aigarchaeota archaeon]MDW8076359.1 phage tail tube protein [Nitrososphaerota archaeon]